MAKKKSRNLGRKLLITLAKVGVTAAALLALFILSIKIGLFGKLPSTKVLQNIQHQQATKIVDKNEATLGFLFRVYRSNVHYEELPAHLIDALIATEDARFYEHDGIDYRSFIRVLVKTILLQDRSAGGGSTITQQLAKNLFPREINNKFDVIIAKMKELLIAKKLESIYKKEEILLLYLNTVSFPDNTFGIGAAAKTFYNKNVGDLSVDESAVLIGSLKANHTYNPRLFPKNSLNRRNIVLGQLLKYEKIQDTTFNRLSELPLALNYHNIKPNFGKAAYFREKIRKQLVEWAAEYEQETKEEIDIYGDGLIIHTTLDIQLQQAAEESMEKHMLVLQKSFEKEWGSRAPWHNYAVYSKYAKQTEAYKMLKTEGKAENLIMPLLEQKEQRNYYASGQMVTGKVSLIDSIKSSIKQLQTGFVALDSRSGDVRAYIGGTDYQHFKFDHVSQSKRQVGSTFKPFIYAAAIHAGVDPCKYFAANAVEYADQKGWKPVNSDNKDYKYLNVTMQEALRKSMNTVSVKVLGEAGISDAIALANRAGIESELPAVPSLALGTAELNMMELATAYMSFLNEGYHYLPRMITKITTATGEVLATFETEKAETQAFDSETADLMLEMMKTVVNKGTASRLRWKYGIKSSIAGKTGTTQQNRDGWFVGLTPDLICVSWVGSDDGAIGFKSTALGQGANSALPIYAGMVQQLEKSPALKKTYLSNFNPPNRAIANQLDCPPVKEDGFFKKIFSNKDKERNFNEEGKQNTNIFNRIKKIFK